MKVLLFALVMFSTASLAAPVYEHRQDRQETRIVQGVAQGQLTGPELARLDQQQRSIARTERRAEADGVVTLHERRNLAIRQNHASRSIARQRHDRQQR